MKILTPTGIAASGLSRRRFVQGLATGVALAGMGNARAGSLPASNNPQVQVLTGTQFDLVVSELAVNFTGSRGKATAINGSVPAPTLVWQEGETVTIRVRNDLAVSTSIHWHGIILPYQMDGVPGISFAGIAPGETFVYQFQVQQSGTYWYHSHSGFQELTGMYGAIIVRPKASDPVYYDRDMAVVLSDWTDENPMDVFAKLKNQSDYYNYSQPTGPDFVRDAKRYGLSEAFAMRKMWNDMRMSPTDLADTSGATFTYLMNGAAPAGNWTGVFKPGERVRLRFINGSSNTFYDVRIPGLKLTVVQADGQDLEPVTVDEFRFGPGETYDVIVHPADEPYTIFAQNMGRSGYARGTLSPAFGLTTAVPVMDKPEWLTMADMMGDMSGGMNLGAMAAPAAKVHHASSEYGPQVDMRVDTPRTNLDDPGIGLRNNGRRVLTLADLHTLGGAMDRRDPEREIELHLTGNMERYSWSFDGIEFGQSTPVHFRYGERVRVTLHNDTMMTHPMHLHGVWSELENHRGEFQARLHTIPVQPSQRISFQVTADAIGRWAWHCHLMFHMDAGMFREVVIA